MVIEYLQQTGEVRAADIFWFVEDIIASAAVTVVHLSVNPADCLLRAQQSNQEWDKMVVLFQSNSYSKTYSLLKDLASIGLNCDLNREDMNGSLSISNDGLFYLCICVRHR